MRSDWPIVKWGDLVELRYGKSLKDYKEEGGGHIPVYGTNGPIGFTDKALCDYPSVIVGRKGAYRGIHFSDKAFFVIDTAFYIEPKIDINLKWAYYQLLTQDINGMDSGSAIPSTSREDFYQLETGLPPIDEQKRIVTILDSLNNKIELNRQINQTLEQIAQAIFKSWFVDFEPVRAKIEAKQSGRDPERAAMCAISGRTEEELDELNADQYKQIAATAALFPGELEKSEFGVIPKGWSWKQLYETAEYVNGAAFKADDFSSDNKGLPIVKIAELKQGISSGTKFTKGDYGGKYAIDTGDILYSWSGSPETSLEVFKWFGGPGWLNQHIFKVNVASKEQKYYVFFLLRHMKSILVRTAQQKQTTGLGHVTVADMKRIKVVYPHGAILNAFSFFSGPLYEENSVLEQQILSLAKTRDYLLPKLLNGEIDLLNRGSVV